jgi:hypothetical protein
MNIWTYLSWYLYWSFALLSLFSNFSYSYCFSHLNNEVMKLWPASQSALQDQLWIGISEMKIMYRILRHKLMIRWCENYMSSVFQLGGGGGGKKKDLGTFSCPLKYNQFFLSSHPEKSKYIYTHCNLGTFFY